jgi:hypothetical protein
MDFKLRKVYMGAKKEPAAGSKSGGGLLEIPV